MSRREELRLRDIVGAIATIREHLGGGEFGLRNLVTHEYFRVDLEVIEDILTTSLGPLETAAKRLLLET